MSKCERSAYCILGTYGDMSSMFMDDCEKTEKIWVDDVAYQSHKGKKKNTRSILNMSNIYIT